MQNNPNYNRGNPNYNPDYNRGYNNYSPQYGYSSEGKTVYRPPMNMNRPPYPPQQRPVQQVVRTQESNNNNTALLIILLSVCITMVVVIGAILIAAGNGGGNNDGNYNYNNGIIDEISTEKNPFFVDPGQTTTRPATPETTEPTTMPEPTTRPNVVDGPDEHEVVHQMPSYYQKGVVLPSYIYRYTCSGTVVTVEIDSSVNLRTGPSKGYSSQKLIKSGTVVTVYGHDYDSNDQIWFYVYYGGKYGWIRGDYLDTYNYYDGYYYYYYEYDFYGYEY